MPPRLTVKDLTGLTPKEANFVIEYTKDFAARRAAEASGFAPDSGYALLKKLHIVTAIDDILKRRLDASHIDAEWVLMEAVDNHMIARQQGNISASTTALTLVAKHVMVDAMASDKQDINHGGTVRLENMSEEDLATRIQQLQTQLEQSEST